MKKQRKIKRGRFIVLDGPDGSGKSTQANLLATELEAHGLTVRSLREPGGTALGEAVRDLLLDHSKIKIGTLAETFLFQAARAQLVHEVIEPALAKGNWVILDRYTLSTLVYQGYAGGIKKKTAKTLSSAATAGLKPDAYIVLWVPPEIGVERRSGRAADRMESKGDDYLDRVFRGFQKEANRHSGRYTLIDGSGAVQDVRKSIWDEVEPLLGE